MKKLSSLYELLRRAVDLDPLGSAFIFSRGSGSGPKREKFKEKNRKNARKLIIVILFKCFK